MVITLLGGAALGAVSWASHTATTGTNARPPCLCGRAPSCYVYLMENFVKPFMKIETDCALCQLGASFSIAALCGA
jgi:hypothetical protein